MERSGGCRSVPGTRLARPLVPESVHKFPREWSTGAGENSGVVVERATVMHGWRDALEMCTSCHEGDRGVRKKPPGTIPGWLQQRSFL